MSEYIEYHSCLSICKTDIEYANGHKAWYLEGKLHREDGPAIEYLNGTKEWWLKGKLHREDGPAIEYPNGDNYWYLNDELHCENGPAIERANGTKAWYLEGEQLTEEEFNLRMNPVRELTVEQISELLGFEVKVVK
jgi:hypothetical protein